MRPSPFFAPVALAGFVALASACASTQDAAQSAGSAPARAPAPTANLPQQADSYFQGGAAALQKRLAVQPNTRRARNVIIFVGDGMGVNTLTAARIFQGQQAGVDGESFTTTMDALPFSGLVKTYAHDAQVSDSAPTATAMFSGVKTRNDIIGLTQDAPLNDCAASKGKEARSIFALAEARGLATGIISTARITHATPAATFAHSANRDWENDSAMPAEAKAAGCVDIARQLVEWPEGDGFEVVFGGGRGQFLPSSAADPEETTRNGLRGDGRDLVAAWRARYPSGTYVWNQAGFAAIDPAKTDKALGLFERDHMKFEAQRAADAAGEPSLAEMTAKAINMLARDQDGFVLMVEAGRIDHAHHGGAAGVALADTVALDEAVKAALALVDPAETLVIVTADHSHNLSIVGYPKRGNPILGLSVDVDGKLAKGADGKPYTTLSYADGPGAVDGARADLSDVDTTAPGFRQPALTPQRSASHGGEDVPARAIGPWAHLVSGTLEQHELFHIAAYALWSAPQ